MNDADYKYCSTSAIHCHIVFNLHITYRNSHRNRIWNYIHEKSYRGAKKGTQVILSKGVSVHNRAR